MSSFLTRGKASIVIDGQFGSTGKGLAAAYQVAQMDKDCPNHNWEYTVCTTNAAPNAGHTTVLPDGTKFITFHMPTMGVLKKDSMIYLNAGAIIDLEVLEQEMNLLDVDYSRVVIHPNAAVITEEDKDYEKNKSSGATQIASTQKGVGRALARKIMREGMTAKDYTKHLSYLGMSVRAVDLNDMMEKGYAVCIETPQGMGLSLNNGFHPHCTSREVSVSQSLSDAGVHPHYLHNTLMTARTYPIRVGNIVDDNGKTIGYSGGVYEDQHELNWEDFPNVEPERTTVTKRVRRIFTFSEMQYRESIARLRPDIVHLGFCDYFLNEAELVKTLNKMMVAHAKYKVNPRIVYSFGPCTTDVLSLHDAVERLSNGN